MTKFLSLIGQSIFYAIFCAIVYYYSFQPPYHYLQPGQGEIKLAFKHVGQPIKACHKRTSAELRKLPPNMRKLNDCVRERSPLDITINLDGKELAHLVKEAPGIHNDGAVFVYSKFPVMMGEHHITVHMSDSVLEPDKLRRGEITVDMRAGQTLVVGYDSPNHTFIFF